MPAAPQVDENGDYFSLLPEARARVALLKGKEVSDAVMQVNPSARDYFTGEPKKLNLKDAEDICAAFERRYEQSTQRQHQDDAGATKSRELQSIELAFRAYRRLGELYDMDPALGMRFEPEQDLLIKAIIAARCTSALTTDEFARHRARLSLEYKLANFDRFLYICFPRRRGKSVALAAITAILLATQINFKVLVVNLSAKLAQQNLLYIRQYFNYLATDPDQVIKCSYLHGGELFLFKSHYGTSNTLVLLANPNHSPNAGRGQGADLINFDEAQYYKQGAFKVVMPVAQVGSIVVKISSLGSNDNYAAKMACRRDPETKRLQYRHYVIQPGAATCKVSTDEPGEGPPFSYSQGQKRSTKPWYMARSITPEEMHKYERQAVVERERSFNIMCLALPAHISLRSFLVLRVVMGEASFNQEMANIGGDDEDATGSVPAFSVHFVERLLLIENQVSLEHLGRPTHIITCVDPSGNGPGSRMPILTFAYYAPPGPVKKEDRTEHRMVLIACDILTREEVESTRCSAERILAHLTMIHMYTLIGGPNIRIQLVIERNYDNGHLATFLRDEIDMRIKKDRVQAGRELGEHPYIDIYKEPVKRQKDDAAGEKMATGFWTHNADKAYGTMRLRHRLEEGKRVFALPVEPIISSSSQGLSDRAIRAQFTGELSTFEIHAPNDLAKRRKMQYHGKRNGTDDLVLCALFAERVYCKDSNDAEREIYRELEVETT